MPTSENSTTKICHWGPGVNKMSSITCNLTVVTYELIVPFVKESTGHTAFWRIVWLHDDFHVNLTEFLFVKWDHYWGWTLAYLLGCISFPWPLSNSALYILNVRNIFLNSFSFCYFSVFVDIGGVRDQFVELFCKNQNPDQSCRPIIGLRALLKRKLIKDFKKVGPILGNPSYNSQCLLFWRDLTQKIPEI